METTYADNCSDMAQPCDMDLWVIKWRSAWPIFHDLVILPYILKTIWCMCIKLKCDPMFDLKIHVRHCDLYFMIQWLCLIRWRLFHIWTSLFVIINQCDQTHVFKINVGHCDLYFMVQIFCFISWRLFDVWTLSLVIMGQYDRTLDLKKCMSLWPIFHGPLICLISQRLFDVWLPYCQIMRQCDTNFDLKINIGQHDL